MTDLRRAVQACREGHLDEAERLCRALLQSSPGDARASLVLCQVLLQRGRSTEAEAAAALALRQHPGHPDLLVRRAEALARLGSTEEAIRSYDEAIDRRLIHPAAHAGLSDLLAKLRDARPRFSVS